ncbi:hypothetical protein SBC1_79510 (plasmid) [Caballeronia sp. SBC1]|uniref:CHASE3 domain-containing protein n=1 Tax=Caballeronia sp. SBC1 TaxID=2705548 RepID=UPI00140C98D2|nr:hypothetical protein [Caballeronia sp. SBC1]QIN67904.1 hypothetical protein SBC1_79510 [Caballeronia sp. SBC1]
MTIRKRLIFTLGVALFALFVAGSFGLWRLSLAQQRFDYVQVNIIPGVKELNDTRTAPAPCEGFPMDILSVPMSQISHSLEYGPVNFGFRTCL